MRTICKIGILLGLFVVAVSIWRWMIFYDSPFRFVVGCFIAFSIMAWAYVIDWITGKDKSDNELYEKIDSLAQSFKGLKELNNLK